MKGKNRIVVLVLICALFAVAAAFVPVGLLN